METSHRDRSSRRSSASPDGRPCRETRPWPGWQVAADEDPIPSPRYLFYPRWIKAKLAIGIFAGED